MNALRRLLGVCAVSLSALGLLLCLLGVAGVWIARGLANRVADGVLDAAADSLAFVDDKLLRAERFVTDGADRAVVIAKAVERLRPGHPDAKAQTMALIKSLDEELAARLKTARERLEATQNVAAGVGKIAQSVLSSKYAASHPDAVGVAIAGRIREVAQQAVEALAALEEARQDLVAMRDNVKIARTIVQRVVARLLDVEKRLARMADRIARLRAGVAETRQAVFDLEKRFHWWSGLAAAAGTLVCAWFGVSQVVMLRRAWSLARRDRNLTDRGSSA